MKPLLIFAAWFMLGLSLQANTPEQYAIHTYYCVYSGVDAKGNPIIDSVSYVQDSRFAWNKDGTPKLAKELVLLQTKAPNRPKINTPYYILWYRNGVFQPPINTVAQLQAKLMQ